jgi:glucose-6-phosphate-specific signal transduction histidine kinase
VGITGMRERVRELGGRLEIHSFKTGTTISVALPLLKSPSPRRPAVVSLSS